MTNCAAMEGVRTRCPMAESIEICSVTQNFPILSLVWPDNDCSIVQSYILLSTGWTSELSLVGDDTHFHACAFKFKPVLQCSHTHSPYCLISQPNLPQCLSCCLTCFGWS